MATLVLVRFAATVLPETDLRLVGCGQSQFVLLHKLDFGHCSIAFGPRLRIRTGRLHKHVCTRKHTLSHMQIGTSTNEYTLVHKRKHTRTFNTHAYKRAHARAHTHVYECTRHMYVLAFACDRTDWGILPNFNMPGFVRMLAAMVHLMTYFALYS